jgi:DNA-binding MarR family transcriptional regulator
MTKSSVPELVERYWETIPPAWHQTRAYIRQVAANRYQLTVEQFQVLRRIRKGIASVSALAEANHTSRSSVSKAVDALVHKGLVHRGQNPQDRRNLPLSLTENGQIVMTGIYQEAERWLTAHFKRLSPGESELLEQAMDVLNKVFSDIVINPGKNR